LVSSDPQESPCVKLVARNSEVMILVLLIEERNLYLKRAFEIRKSLAMCASRHEFAQQPHSRPGLLGWTLWPAGKRRVISLFSEQQWG
jgi:hypothetical protein